MRALKSLSCLIAALGTAAAFAPAAPAAPPPNDNYLGSFTMLGPDGRPATGYHDLEDTTEATVQSDLFTPDRNGAPLTGGGPEPAQCGPSPYGKTVWYDYLPPYAGGTEIRAAGFNTTVAVYEYDVQTAKVVRQIACRVSSTGATNEVLALVKPTPGHALTIQVGGLVTAGVPSSGRLDFTFHYFRDTDADGVLDDEPDVCLRLPGIPPSGCPPTLAAVPRHSWTVAGGGIRLRALTVTHVAGGSRVEARCRRCGLRQVVQAGAGGGTVRLAKLVGRTLPAGSTLEIWVTHAPVPGGEFRNGAIGSYFRFAVRRNGLGDRVDRCLLPGSMRPRRTCR
jgi:hypothetical protein